MGDWSGGSAVSIFLEVEPPATPQVAVVEAPFVVSIEPPTLAVTAGPAPLVFVNAPETVGVVVPISGIPGPSGPPGPPGPSGGTYTHTQTIPAAVWTIEHNLGYDPGGVVVILSDGYFATGWALQYLQAGQSLRLSFDLAITGSAVLS